MVYRGSPEQAFNASGRGENRLFLHCKPNPKAGCAQCIIAPVAKPRANLRLFVALHPPAAIAQAMLDCLQGLDDVPDRKTTPVEQVHMTLQFIGDTPVAALEQTIESVQRAAAGLPTFALQPMKMITLPERGSSRLIACETDSPAALLELQRRLVQRLARTPRDPKEQRFRPHLTLARFRAPASRFRVEREIGLQAFEVHLIRLMRSTLDPAGAQHHELASIALG